MKFYSSKFECLRYAEGRFPSVKQLNDRGEPIDAKNHVKDLGVHMSKDCTFGFHIRNIEVRPEISATGSSEYSKIRR